MTTSRLRRTLLVCLTATVTVGSSASLWAQDEAAEAVAPVARARKPFDVVNGMITWSRADSVVETARSQVGARYKWGAKAPGRAFDCSSLVQYVMEKVNVVVPRTAREQAKVGAPLPKDVNELQPGDLLYFGRGRLVTHVGVYVGDGRYVHAANRRKGVIESRVPTSGERFRLWWKGARRVLDGDKPGPDAGLASYDQTRRYEPGETPVLEGPAS